jgi:hypothetical protein
MGKTQSNTKTVRKKNEAKKWNREKFLESLVAVVESRKGKDIYHIISRGDSWGVLREGCKRMYKIHSDKQSAIAHARRLAQKSSKWEVVVHREDGSPDRYIYADK